MNPSLEFQPKVASPEQEINKLRESVINYETILRERGIETSTNQAAKEVVKSYAGLPHEEVLEKEYVMNDKEAGAITLELSPESHDVKMGELLSLMQEKGIKNVLSVIEKMNDPHIFDDFHRFLVQFIASGYPIADLKEKDFLWKPLHMTLFEISLPEASEEDKNKHIKELISGMEQFYSGMLSISSDKNDPMWFSVEIACANGSDQFVFYVSVPTKRKELFEKQILAVFPGSLIKEHKDDYNIFNEQGVSVAGSAKLSKQFLYPLKPYEEFNIDPLGVILNSFSKIDKDGEGAAIQLIVGGRRDDLFKSAEHAIENIKKGEKVSDAVSDIDRSLGSSVFKELTSIFKSAEKLEKENEAKEKRAQNNDQKAIEQFIRKIKSSFISVNIRAAASSSTEEKAKTILNDIESAFNQFENGHGNRIEWQKMEKGNLRDFLENFSLRTFDEKNQMILNIEEMTTCLHFPATHIGKAAPQLKQSLATSAPAPSGMSESGIYLGVNNYRNAETKVYIQDQDRLRHMYVVGQTGTGKTVFLKNSIIQDINRGNGCCFIDPHGTDIFDILSNIPESRYKDVIYFDPAYTERPMALNMLEYDPKYPEQKTFVVNELFSIFQKLYGAVPESMGPMFEQYFRNATMLVIEDPETGHTLLDVSRVMSNKAYRDLKISKCKNPVVVQFWKEVAEKAGGDAALANIVPYITSKFDVFLANDIMRPIVAQEKSSFNFREIMDGRKILLVNLSKGRLGAINANLIGLILVGKILMASLSRVDLVGKDFPAFYLYMDEFQNITTDSISSILSEARKYKLSLTVAHQFIAQLEEKIKDSVFGNVGSIVSFRVSAEDAEYLEKQFSPTFTAKDIMNIENLNAYVKMLVNGIPSKAFNIREPFPPKGDAATAEKLKQLSYETYGGNRAEIEATILEKYKK